jgi:outer membrane receptor protein involved in Fe transport
VSFSQLPTLIAASGGTPRAADRLEDDQWIPAVKLQYFADDNTMLYFTVASGFKAGGVNSSNINVYTRSGDTFGAEEALSFELGGKFTLLDGAAQLNAAVYRTEFDDLQTATITPQGAVTVVNAAGAVTQGIEIDATWRLAEAVTVGGAYAWLDAYYEDSEALSCGGYMTNVREAAGEDFSTTPCTYRLDDMPNGDDSLQRAPEHTFTLWGEYLAPLAAGWDLQVYGALNVRDESSTVLDNYFYAEDLTLLNGRVALHDTRRGWSVALYGNNLLDEDSLVLHQDNSAGAIKGMITTPRTYGVQVVKEFF